MFTLTCPACSARVSLAPHRLLVQVASDGSGGELVFTCIGCHQTSVVDVRSSTVAVLLHAGVTGISLAEQVVEHPERIPAGPGFTTDDVLDLHAALDDPRWFDALLSGRYASPAGDAC